MAIGQETEGRGLGGFMQRSQKQWEQQRMIEAQEEMRRQREMQAEEAKKEKPQDGGGEKKKDTGPASKSGLNTPSSSIVLPDSARSAFPAEARVGAGVGGSTGHVVHFDPGKAPGYLDGIAQKYGIDPTDFKRMAWIESKFDPNAKAGSSSAGGLFQFTNDTARSYGLSNKFDGPANAEAAARLWNDNKAGLTQALGRPPTAGELYLAHQQGLGGAKALLSNPNAPASSLVGHKAVVNNGGSSRMSGGEFARMWTNKFDSLNVTASADGATPRNRDAGNTRGPVQVAANTTTMNDASPAPRPSSDVTPGSGTTQTTPPAATQTTTGAAPAPGASAPLPPRRPNDLNPEFPNNSGQAPGMPPRRPEMGPTMSEMTQPAAPAQPGQQATQPESGNFIDDIGKGIGGFFDSLTGNGEPIKDKYGRTWDGFEGWVDPKAGAEKRPSEAIGSVQTNDSAGSMLDQSSAATAATADSSKSILSDMPDIGSAFTPALNFFSSIFG